VLGWQSPRGPSFLLTNGRWCCVCAACTAVYLQLQTAQALLLPGYAWPRHLHIPPPLLLLLWLSTYIWWLTVIAVPAAAVACLPAQVDGYHLRVDRASAPRTTAAPSSAAGGSKQQAAAAGGGDKAGGGSGVTNPRCTVFVGNLDFRVGVGTVFTADAVSPVSIQGFAWL
jgi:hypothetical protein